jgi:hypothetical protein
MRDFFVKIFIKFFSRVNLGKFYRFFHKMEFKAFKGGSKAIGLARSKK